MSQLPSNSIQLIVNVNGQELRYSSKSQGIRDMHFSRGMSILQIHQLTKIRYQMIRNIVKNYENAQVAGIVFATQVHEEETE